MTTLYQEIQAELFFIATEVETELIAIGYHFESPSYFVTLYLPAVLASFTDAELVIWLSELSKEEIRTLAAAQCIKGRMTNMAFLV